MNRQQQIDASKKASQVYDLRVRGWRTSEIAETLGIPERTVRYLIQHGDRLTDGRIRQLTRGGALRQLLLAHEARERKLWELSVKTKNDTVKATCLRQLVEEEKKFEQLLIRLGVLDQQATIEEVDVNLQATLKTLVEHATPEDIRQISALLRESVNVRRN